MQLAVYPLKAEVWKRLQAERVDVCASAVYDKSIRYSAAPADMGLAAGGRMRQEIYDDPFQLSDWDTSHWSRCFVHLANSMLWRQITGEEPPTVPPTAEEYTRAGLPWFEWYGERPALDGSKKLGKVKGVHQLGKEKGQLPLPENTAVDPAEIVHLRKGLKRNEVREGAF